MLPLRGDGCQLLLGVGRVSINAHLVSARCKKACGIEKLGQGADPRQMLGQQNNHYEQFQNEQLLYANRTRET